MLCNSQNTFYGFIKKYSEESIEQLRSYDLITKERFIEKERRGFAQRTAVMELCKSLCVVIRLHSGFIQFNF